MRRALPQLHAWIGIVALSCFLFTGAWMGARLDHLQGMAPGPRLLYRSAHGYLLLAACANGLLGAHWRPVAALGLHRLQALGSGAIALAPALLLAAFFIEPGLAGLERHYARAGLYLMAAGTVLHAMAAALSRPRRTSS